MDILILSIFTIVVILSFMEDYMQSWQKMLVLLTIGIALVCIAAFKPMSTTDATTYEYYYLCNDDIIVELATEPTYIYLSRFLMALGCEVVVLFFIYAIMTIPLKLYALYKLTPYVFTAMIVYVGIYYPLQDVVQIRCGAATAFLLLSLISLAKRNYFSAFSLTIVATLFHYSSLAFLPILFIGNIPIGKYWKILLGASIPFCLACYAVGIGAVSLIPSSLMEGKMDLYKEMSDAGGWAEYVPYKQLTFLVEFVVLYLFIFYYETIHKHCIYAPILIKILVLEMVCLTMLSEIPVLGGRLHDLFGIFNALSITCCLYCVKPKFVARIGIAVFALGYYLIQMFDEMYFK